MLPTVDTLPGDGYGGRGRHVTPPGADASLIFLHGRGDKGDSWRSLATILNNRDNLRGRVRLFLPTADRIMVTRYRTRMNAWFDSRSERHDVDEDFEGFEMSRKRVESIIQREVLRGIRPERIILAGFSQGGAMTYFAGLRSEIPIGGAACLSGWCPFLDDLRVSQAFANSGAQFLHQHGMQDPVVSYQFAEESFHQAEAATQRASSDWSNITGRFHFKTYINLDHTANALEMDDLVEFIESCLTRNPPESPPANGTCVHHA